MSAFVFEKTDESQGRLALAAELTISTVAELQIALGGALEECRVLTLDGRGVGDIDVAGLQLLCSVHRTAAAHGKEVRIDGLDEGPWPELVNAAGLRRHEACSLSTDKRNCLWR